MLTSEQKEVLVNLYDNVNFEYSNFEIELKCLKNDGYVKLDFADDEIYNAKLTSKGSLLVKNNFSQELFENHLSCNSINGNNNNIILNSKISDSFNSENINDFVEEIMQSNESDDLKNLISKWNIENQELLKNTIELIKSSNGKKSKLNILKDFSIKIGTSLTNNMLEKVLNIITTYF